jgi:hypothetical protein
MDGITTQQLALTATILGGVGGSIFAILNGLFRIALERRHPPPDPNGIEKSVTALLAMAENFRESHLELRRQNTEILHTLTILLERLTNHFTEFQCLAHKGQK